MRGLLELRGLFERGPYLRKYSIHLVQNSLDMTFSKSQKLHYARTWCIEESTFSNSTFYKHFSSYNIEYQYIWLNNSHSTFFISNLSVYFVTQSFLSSVTGEKNWGFRWQEITFLLLKTVLNWEIHAISFRKKIRVKPGTALIEYRVIRGSPVLLFIITSLSIGLDWICPIHKQKRHQITKRILICKWIYFAISTFAILEEIAFIWTEWLGTKCIWFAISYTMLTKSRGLTYVGCLCLTFWTINTQLIFY